MFRSIAFYIGEKTLDLNGHAFPLGELTAEVLNITPDEYHKLRRILVKAVRKMADYEKSRQMQDWFEANEQMIKLHRSLVRHRVFQLLQEQEEILSEARVLTEQYSLFQEPEDLEPTERDLEILAAIGDYEDYLEHPEEYGGDDFFGAQLEDGFCEIPVPRPPIPPEPPEKTRALLICPGNLQEKWVYYRQYCMCYDDLLEDISSVCQTLQAFIRMGIASLDKLTPDNYLAALHEFLYSERSYKWIANPLEGTGFYTAIDDVRLQLVPRETSPDSGAFKVYEYYETMRLQTMLKLDFYKALEAGHIIRKCQNCGRYFLLQKGYHTKYCDLPNPANPKYTCAQLGYRLRGIKEDAGGSPLAQALYRCYQRIDKDRSRGVITAEERTKLREKAQELYHQARTKPGTTYEAFNTSLAAERLYPRCGVERKSRPRGRPKREG